MRLWLTSQIITLITTTPLSLLLAPTTTTPRRRCLTMTGTAMTAGSTTSRALKRLPRPGTVFGTLLGRPKHPGVCTATTATATASATATAAISREPQPAATSHQQSSEVADEAIWPFEDGDSSFTGNSNVTCQDIIIIIKV
ncbi:hypothetical protein VaNZ11_016448 [Volvox africanus]|uniref:Secreted protein n=1 Tax=Volvox africanus TaxID=51714 RepID=A0ABQ5SQF4_9CHLO|nr:hypothetical protein VaNZ11_016448 [Volvox africanus]